MWATFTPNPIAWFLSYTYKQTDQPVRQLLQNMNDQELMDRLAELTEHLASCRGLNASYEFCKMDIEDTQQEIEARMQQRDGRLNVVNGS
jgi:hypothetical protein